MALEQIMHQMKQNADDRFSLRSICGIELHYGQMVVIKL